MKVTKKEDADDNQGTSSGMNGGQGEEPQDNYPEFFQQFEEQDLIKTPLGFKAVEVRDEKGKFDQILVVIDLDKATDEALSTPEVIHDKYQQSEGFRCQIMGNQVYVVKTIVEWDEHCTKVNAAEQKKEGDGEKGSEEPGQTELHFVNGFLKGDFSKIIEQMKTAPHAQGYDEGFYEIEAAGAKMVVQKRLPQNARMQVVEIKKSAAHSHFTSKFRGCLWDDKELWFIEEKLEFDLDSAEFRAEFKGFTKQERLEFYINLAFAIWNFENLDQSLLELTPDTIMVDKVMEPRVVISEHIIKLGSGYKEPVNAAYASPLRAPGNPVTNLVDTYSLGVIIAFLERNRKEPFLNLAEFKNEEGKTWAEYRSSEPSERLKQFMAFFGTELANEWGSAEVEQGKRRNNLTQVLAAIIVNLDANLGPQALINELRAIKTAMDHANQLII